MTERTRGMKFLVLGVFLLVVAYTLILAGGQYSSNPVSGLALVIGFFATAYGSALVWHPIVEHPFVRSLKGAGLVVLGIVIALGGVSIGSPAGDWLKDVFPIISLAGLVIIFTSFPSEPNEIVTQPEPIAVPNNTSRAQPVTSGYSFASESEEKTEVEAPAQPQVVREIIKEKETIRELVKIRCAHCRTLYEENLGRCPNCGAPA